LYLPDCELGESSNGAAPTKQNFVPMSKLNNHYRDSIVFSRPLLIETGLAYNYLSEYGDSALGEGLENHMSNRGED
jgi:hypothetical protein